MIRVSLVSKETGHVFRVPVLGPMRRLKDPGQGSVKVEEVTFAVTRQVFDVLDEWVFRPTQAKSCIEWVSCVKMKRHLIAAIERLEEEQICRYSPVVHFQALAAMKIMRFYASKDGYEWWFEEASEENGS